MGAQKLYIASIYHGARGVKLLSAHSRLFVNSAVGLCAGGPETCRRPEAPAVFAGWSRSRDVIFQLWLNNNNNNNTNDNDNNNNNNNKNVRLCFGGI